MSVSEQEHNKVCGSMNPDECEFELDEPELNERTVQRRRRMSARALNLNEYRCVNDVRRKDD